MNRKSLYSLLSMNLLFNGCNSYTSSNAAPQKRLFIGKKISTPPTNIMKEKTDISIFSMSWKSSGFLATGASDGNIRIWHIDQDTGKFVDSISYQRMHGCSVEAVAWSPDEQYLASGADIAGSDECELKIWHFDKEAGGLSYKPITIHQTNGVVESIAWSPDGKYLAAGLICLKKQIKIWYFHQNKLSEQFLGKTHGSFVGTLSWHPSNNRILASGALAKNQQLSCWKFNENTDKLTKICHRDFDHEVTATMWSPDGNYLATANFRGTVAIWQAIEEGVVSSKPIYAKNYGWNYLSLDWSASGHLAVAPQNGKIEILEIENPTKHVKKICTRQLSNKGVELVLWDPSGNFLATATGDKKIQIWKFTRSAKELELVDITSYSTHPKK